MEIVQNPELHAEEIKQCISKFGYSPEHNYYYFIAGAEQGGKCLFLKTRDGYGALANYREQIGELKILAEMLAPPEKQIEVLKELLVDSFKELPVRKFVIEQDSNLMQRSKLEIKKLGFRPLKPRYVLYWPVFDMQKWDPGLQGSVWKNLRNLKNRFYKENQVKVQDSHELGVPALIAIVERWIQRRQLLGMEFNRKDSNVIYSEQYINLIKLGLENLKLAKSLVVNGVPRTITAGWEVPNVEGYYYSSVGICDYSCEGIFEAANIDDLCRLKELGYRYVDFGASPMPLLKFKLKFKPSFVHITHTYAIEKK